MYDPKDIKQVNGEDLPDTEEFKSEFSNNKGDD